MDATHIETDGKLTKYAARAKIITNANTHNTERRTRLAVCFVFAIAIRICALQ